MLILGIIGIWQITIIFAVLFVLLLPLIALIDILKSEFAGSNKLIWVTVVIAFPVIGTVLYFFIGKQQKIS